MKEFITMIAMIFMCVTLTYSAYTHAKIYQKRQEYKCKIECADTFMRKTQPQKSQRKKLSNCLRNC